MVRIKKIYPFMHGIAGFITDALYVGEEINIGYIDKKGKIIIEPKYKPIFLLNSLLPCYNFTDTGCCIVVDKDNKYLLINNEGYVYCKYDNIRFENGLIIVRKKDKYGIINCVGEVIVPIIYDKIENCIGVKTIKHGKYRDYSAYTYFYDSALFSIKSSSAKYGSPSINSFNNGISIELEPEFKYQKGKEMYFYGTTNKSVYVYVKNDKCFGENYNPKVPFEFNSSSVSTFFENITAIVSDNKNVYLVDKYGQQLICLPKNKYSIEKNKDGYFSIIQKSIGYYDLVNDEIEKVFSAQLIDSFGKYVVEEKYDYFKILDSKFILAFKNGKIDLWNTYGKKLNNKHSYTNIMGKSYDDIYLAEFQDDEGYKYVYIDQNGNELFDGKIFYQATLFNDEYAVVMNKKIDKESNISFEYNNHIVIDRNGNEVFSLVKGETIDYFEYVLNPKGSKVVLGKLQNEEKFVFYDFNGNEINRVSGMDAKYINDYFIITIEENSKALYMIYNKYGQPVFNELFDDISVLDSDRFCLNKNDEFILLDTSYTDSEDINLNNFSFLIVEYIQRVPLDRSKSSFDIYLTMIKEYIQNENNRPYKVWFNNAPDVSNLEYFKLVNLKQRIKPYMEVSFGDEDSIFEIVDDHYEFKKDVLDILEYFDLSGISFNNVDIRGIDFTNTNATIDPQMVYKSDISGCKFNRLNLVLNCSLDNVITNGCIIDNYCLDEMSIEFYKELNIEYSKDELLKSITLRRKTY